MNKGLLIKALIKFIAGIIILMALLFLPVLTFSYWQAWLLMGVLFIPMFIVGIFLYNNNQELLKKRLNAKEGEAEQKKVLLFSAIMFLLAFIIASFNIKYSWFILPSYISYAAAFIFLVGYMFYFEVLRENEYLSRTIEIQVNQKVVDTGLYGIVRHPMYMATLLMFLAMPLVLGSFFSFLIMLFYIPIIVKRIKNEEIVLEKGLEGYVDYKKKVKYRIIPYIW